MWYAGRHEAIVGPSLFDAVQEVLDGLGTKLGERQRQYSHYLKTNSVVCTVPRERY